VQAAAVRIGNVRVPTLPLGATPPTQFVVSDQFAAPGPTGVAPLHVKFVKALPIKGWLVPPPRGRPRTDASTVAGISTAAQPDPGEHDIEYRGAAVRRALAGAASRIPTAKTRATEHAERRVSVLLSRDKPPINVTPTEPVCPRLCLKAPSPRDAITGAQQYEEM
jgi:hypothetical protein